MPIIKFLVKPTLIDSINKGMPTPNQKSEFVNPLFILKSFKGIDSLLFLPVFQFKIIVRILVIIKIPIIAVTPYSVLFFLVNI